MTINYELSALRKDGTYHVRIIITNGRGPQNRKRISTNIYAGKKDVTVTYLNKERTRTRVRIKNQDILDKINTFIIQCRNNYRNEGIVEEKVSTEKAVSVMLGDSNLPSFFTFFDSWLENCKKKGKKNYKTARNSFLNFLGHDIEFKDITPIILQEYCDSLEGDRAPSLYLGSLRYIWNQADKLYDEQMPKSPFRKFEVPSQKSKGQRAVSLAVIQKIFTAVAAPGSRAELARDCYIMSFGLMGMNAADMYDITVYENGTLKYDRHKTRDRREDVHMEVDVPEYIRPLVEKYRDPSGKRVFNFYQRYKSSADDLTRALDIGLHQLLPDNPEVVFYSARHTWATFARNEIGANKYDVNDGLIHKDRLMDVTDLYIKKDYRAVNRLNQQVLEWVLKTLPTSQPEG